jgi:hypothetical protein
MMNERIPAMDDATLKVGLLMESAQAHQKLAETHLERLRAHTQDLDAVVRDEIRRTLISELQSLSTETKRAHQVFRRLGRGALLRSALWSTLTAVLCASIPLAIIHWMLPSEAEIAALKSQRDQMAANISALQKSGGHIEVRHCGDAARLCIRVDRKAPVYGDKADYYVAAGY